MSRLDEIKARAEAATEGPWARDMHSPDMSGRSGWYIRGPRELGLRSMVLNSRMLSGDAEFIEAVREDVPWLVDQVESLERWKVEALEVMSGLRELGKALGLQPGVRITGPAALAEVERLTRVIDAKPRQPLVVLNEYLDRAERAEAEVERLTAELAEVKRTYTPCDLDLLTERDALATQVARVEEVLEHWRTVDEGNAAYAERIGERSRFADGLASRADMLRDALTGSEAEQAQPTDQEDQS